MEAVTTITLRFDAPNILTKLYAVQNDRLSRYISAELYTGAAAWSPPAGVGGAIRFRKPDGTSGFYDADENGNSAITFDGNHVKMYLAEQVLTVPGIVPMELNLYTAAGEKLTSFSWELVVKPSILPDSAIQSTDYYNTLTAQIAEALEYKMAAAESAEQAADSAAQADSAATYVTSLAGIYGKAAHDNLLDNSNFLNPVNQRNNTSYTTANTFCFDRWYIGTSPGATIKAEYVGSSGIKLSGGASGANGCNLRQRIPATGLTGKTLTAAVKVAALQAGASVKLGVMIGDDVVASTAISGAGIAVLSFAVPENASTVSVVFGNLSSAGGTGTINVTFAWAALYLGEYTGETLPAYQPKRYSAELEECKRYLRVYSGAMFPISNNPDGTIIPAYIVDANMRTTPTVTFSGGNIFYGSTSYVSIVNVSATVRSGGIAMSITTSSALPGNSNGIAQFSTLALNAEL